MVQTPIRPETPLDGLNGGLSGSVEPSNLNLERVLRGRGPLHRRPLPHGRLAPFNDPKPSLPQSHGAAMGNGRGLSSSLSSPAPPPPLPPSSSMSSSITTRDFCEASLIQCLHATSATTHEVLCSVEVSRQLQLLKTWAADSHNLLSNALMEALSRFILHPFIETFHSGELLRERLAAASTSAASTTQAEALCQSQLALQTALVLLRCASLINEEPLLEEVVATLQILAEAGLMHWLLQELVFDLLLHLLRSLTPFTVPHCKAMYVILSMLRLCCYYDNAGNHDDDDDHGEAATEQPMGWLEEFEGHGSPLSSAVLHRRRSGPPLDSSLSALGPSASQMISSPLEKAGQKNGSCSLSSLPSISDANKRSTGESGHVMANLVTLGILPVLQQVSSAVMDSSNAVPAARPSLLPVICCIYRDLSCRNAQHVLRLGTVETLVQVLRLNSDDAATVEAAARALVRLSYHADGLAAMQSNTDVMTAAAFALSIQLHRAAEKATTLSSLHVLVSRLCSVMGRIAETNPNQQDCLATYTMPHDDPSQPPTTSLLIMELAKRYLVCGSAADGSGGKGERSGSDGGDDAIPSHLLQAVVWLIGIAAMSTVCSLSVVRCVCPLLLRLLQKFHDTPSAHLMVIYVLMCLSNFSFLFHQFGNPQLGDTASISDGHAATPSPSTAAAAAAAKAVQVSWLVDFYASFTPLLHQLLQPNSDVEVIVEVTRLLGNISYTNAGRDWIEANGFDAMVLDLLDYPDLRVVYNCCGVALNLTAASPCRVVEDAALLQVLLAFTGRYTQSDGIEAAARKEEMRLTQLSRFSITLPPSATATSNKGGTRRLAEVLSAEEEEEEGENEGLPSWAREAAIDYATQVADIVEKLLMNIRGLMPPMHPVGN